MEKTVTDRHQQKEKFKATKDDQHQTQEPNNSMTVFLDEIPPLAGDGNFFENFPVDAGLLDWLDSDDYYGNNNLFMASIQTTPLLQSTTEPATPNSSSITSSSNESAAVKAAADQEEEQNQAEEDKTKKLLKPRKTNQKKQREPRFAFVTKTDMDHLDDGFRWRKYGQKAVKNSPHPRSYYRCTTSACVVKKRVERSSEDPTLVVTTYEGQHTHPNPVVPRGGSHCFAGISPQTAVTAGGVFMPRPLHPPHHHHHPRPFASSPNDSATRNNATAGNDMDDSCVFVRDHGLLQDILVPWQVQDDDRSDQVKLGE